MPPLIPMVIESILILKKLMGQCQFFLLNLGETLSFESLIYSLFEFVQVLMDISTYKGSVKSSMEELCYYLILCMQITEEEVNNLKKKRVEFDRICRSSLTSMNRGRKMYRVTSKTKAMILSHIRFVYQRWNYFW